jgi:hypothetical protein
MAVDSSCPRASSENAHVWPEYTASRPVSREVDIAAHVPPCGDPSSLMAASMTAKEVSSSGRGCPRWPVPFRRESGLWRDARTRKDGRPAQGRCGAERVARGYYSAPGHHRTHGALSCVRRESMVEPAPAPTHGSTRAATQSRRAPATDGPIICAHGAAWRIVRPPPPGVEHRRRRL